MAIVKTLIVKGVARFLTDAYMSTIRSGIWNGSTIQVGYGGTGVTSAKGNLYTPVFLSSSGIAPCSVEIPHATKTFKINGVTFDVFTNSTGTAPTIFAPTTLAGTGGYILATNAAKTGLEWVAKPAANVTTTAVVAAAADGTTQISSAQSNPYYNLLEGGAVTRSIQFTSSNITISSTTGGVISFIAKNWTGATSEAAGTAGYMPAPTSALRGQFLRGDGSWISLSLTDHTHSVKINGSTKTIAAPGGTAVDLGSYLPLSGGTMSLGEGLKFHSDENYFGTNSDARIISLLDGNGTTCDGGLIIDERATLGGVEHVTELLRIRDSEFKWKGAIIAHASNISNKEATIGTSLTTIATIAGVDITAKISSYAASSHTHSVKINGSTKTIAAPGGTAVDLGNYLTQAFQLTSVSKTLTVSTWTDMAAVSTYSGTYAIQISDGTLYASGIFSVCGGTDAIIDEIPLHVSSTVATWRPYARVSGTNLLMTTNEATGTARTYTIKILKLI